MLRDAALLILKLKSVGREKCLDVNQRVVARDNREAVAVFLMWQRRDDFGDALWSGFDRLLQIW